VVLTLLKLIDRCQPCNEPHLEVLVCRAKSHQNCTNQWALADSFSFLVFEGLVWFKGVLYSKTVVKVLRILLWRCYIWRWLQKWLRRCLQRFIIGSIVLSYPQQTVNTRQHVPKASSAIRYPLSTVYHRYPEARILEIKQRLVHCWVTTVAADVTLN
jgi:hypothetical protein